MVTVADQEADIYELFALPRRTNSELLIRAYHNRSVKTFAEAAALEVTASDSTIPRCGQLNLELQRQPQRQPRESHPHTALCQRPCFNLPNSIHS